MKETKIRLRAMEPEDLDLLYHIENDHDLWNVGTTNVPYSRYALHDYMASQTGDIYADRQVRLMVENGAGKTVGIVDMMNFDPRHLRAEVGIAMLETERRKGYAEAALLDVIRYASQILHLHQLYAYVSDDNQASRGLFEKVGFQMGNRLHHWVFDGHEYHDALLLQFFL